MHLDHRSIREYGVLHRGGSHGNIDRLSLVETDWDWLHSQAPRFADENAEFLKPVHRDGHYALQVSHYVGVIELPSGQVLEILPKISEVDTIEECRSYIIRMLTRVHHLPFKQSIDASLMVFERPLLEILIGQFLSAAQQVINKGLRFDYRLTKNESTYLRGRLDVQQYAQSPANKKLQFPVEYDEYVSNRPENRLLHWAVRTVFYWSKDNHHRAHARKIMILLTDVPPSVDPKADVREWSTKRLMRHYRSIKPWIDLILAEQTPLSQKGQQRGVSMLFPMETLFERYVMEVIKHHLPAEYSLKYDREGGKLGKYKDKYMLSLRPDFQIQYRNQTISVMDTKWKRLSMADSNIRTVKNISRNDLYQLFAYAMKILPDGGNLFLIYPKSSEFTQPMSNIELSDKHKLSVVPFDLISEKLPRQLNPVDWEQQTGDYQSNTTNTQ